MVNSLWSHMALAALLITGFITDLPAADQAPPAKTDAAQPAAGNNAQAAKEKAFTELLTGVTLVGHFSEGKKDKNQPERYEIATVQKVGGDNWVVTAKIKFGENSTAIPILVKVYWADNTPVLSLTDLTIPGMGTFTSRVMFFGDRYAGTWQHDAHGGHLWGRIEATQPSEKSPSSPKPATP